MSERTNLKTSLVISVFLVAMGPAVAAGGTIYVDVNAPGPTHDGSSWATAYKYLQDALNKPPASGDEIWVAEGTYKPDQNSADPNGSGSRSATFQLINGVAIYGGFAGGETGLEQRNWQTNETILSGDLNGDDVGFSNNGENSYHVVNGSGTDETAVLDGFTITAGNTSGNGGGLYNSGGSLTLTNCTFSGNSADYHGSGMYNHSGSPTLTNCTFNGNKTGSQGGGMWNYYSSAILINCAFRGNSADWGGGVCNIGGSVTLTSCTFRANSAANNGGGMENDGGSPTVTSCTFSGNSAWGGGGMWNDGASPIVTNCTFSGNEGYRGGGMHNYSGSSSTVTNCTFGGNSVAEWGGGMFNSYSNPAVTNCIMWGNTAASGAQIYNYSSSPTVTYNCVQGGYGGTGNIDADPLFVDADGPDNIVGTEDDDLRLSAGSPCIDAGDNTAVPSGVTTDLDGNPRFIDDPDTTDTGNGTPPIVDMGAYEYSAPPIIFVDASATGSNDGSSWADAYNYLQDALADANSFGEPNKIWVAQGTYKPDANTAYPTGSGDRTATFQLINGVAIYGGFASGETSVGERDWRTNETILSGDLDGNDVDVNDPCDLLTEPTRAENSYHVIISSGTNATAVLDGFTITAGNANGSYPNRDGGGMFNLNNSSPTVTNCTFSENSAGYYGGGMSNRNSSPVVTNCMFSGNSGTYGGGMENLNNSSPMVANCTFSGNSAAHSGGGMCNSSSNPTVTNCTFSGNSADYEGGGMKNDSVSPTVTNCTFSENSAGYYGGGMSNLHSSSTVTSCTFSGNSADARGGGMYIYGKYAGSCSPTLTNCMFIGNSANALGGGMWNSQSSPMVSNCTFSGNSAQSGGGMYNRYEGSPTVTNCTFSGNSADYEGGGMHIYGEYGSCSPTLTNCTFAGNSATNGNAMACDSPEQPYPGTVQLSNCILWDGGDEIWNNDKSTITITYSDVQGGDPCCYDPCEMIEWGDGNIDADPCFIDADNPDPNLRDYHLRPGSPCIDTGDNTALPADTADLDGDGNTVEPIPFDIDSDVRVSDDTVDMGSDEVIWDGATGISPGGLVTLNPGGGPNDPNTEALVVFDNNSATDANITVVEMGSTAHPKVQGFQALGKTLRIDTSLADGEFFMTATIPFDVNDLGGEDWFAVDLMYWEEPPGKWRHAVWANTDPKQSNPKFIKDHRWPEEYPPTAAPSLEDLKARGMGANGVFWNSETEQGFVWANVDHTTDFEGMIHNIADFEPDGDVDFVDFAWFAPNWLDTGCDVCGGADLTGDGNVDFYDLKEFTDNWLVGR